MDWNELSLQSERIENTTIFKAIGALNAFTSKKFLDEISKAMKKGPVIIDMEELHLITSSGVTALRELANFSYSSKVRVLLINLSLSAKQVFQMAGIRNLFLIPENEEAAMKIASRPYR